MIDIANTKIVFCRCLSCWTFLEPTQSAIHCIDWRATPTIHTSRASSTKAPPLTVPHLQTKSWALFAIYRASSQAPPTDASKCSTRAISNRNTTSIIAGPPMSESTKTMRQSRYLGNRWISLEGRG